MRFPRGTNSSETQYEFLGREYAGLATVRSKETKAREESGKDSRRAAAVWLALCVVVLRSLAPVPGTVAVTEGAPVFGGTAVAVRPLSPNADKPEGKITRGGKLGT